MKYILVAVICHYKQWLIYDDLTGAEMFMCTRFSGWLNEINITTFLSLTPAEKLTAFFRPQSNLQYRKLNWRNTYVWGSCCFMFSTEKPCLQINNVSKHSRNFLGKKNKFRRKTIRRLGGHNFCSSQLLLIRRGNYQSTIMNRKKLLSAFIWRP